MPKLGGEAAPGNHWSKKKKTLPTFNIADKIVWRSEILQHPQSR